MATEDWKGVAASLFKSDDSVSFISKLRDKIASLFHVTQTGINDLAGLDIGPDRIYLLRIDTSSSPFEIVEYASAPLPSGVIVKDEIKNPAAIGHALREMLRASGITAKYAAVAIPRTLAMIKTITVDKRLSAGEIESRARVESVYS